MSYRTQILDHLMPGDTLDPIKALNLFGCFALSQRITDLKKKVSQSKDGWSPPTVANATPSIGLSLTISTAKRSKPYE